MTGEKDGMVSMFGPDTWSGKTSPEHSAPTAAKTSKPSSRNLPASQSRTLPLCLCLMGGDGLKQDASTQKWENGALLGEYMTRSFGEFPNEESESRLSQILEDSPHPKYSLSAKACMGILNRAQKRGKELPLELKEALLRQCSE